MMNKNPFVPIPSFPQPPLPPGPPPAQAAGQTDYSAYWAAAAAQQQQQQQQSHASIIGQVGTAAYNPQWPNTGQGGWTAPQPVQAPSTPVKPGEHSALYANYGYGGQHSLHWQQQQQQNQQHHHHHQPHYSQPPVAAPPQAPQPQYNPYQPQQAAAGALYQQPYVPQAGGAPIQQPSIQQPYRPAQQPPPQAYYPQQPHHQLQHTPPHQLPPAKRQRFDTSHQHQPPPPQPRFQPPPPPPPQANAAQHGFGRSHSMGGPPPGGGAGGGGGGGQIPIPSSGSFIGGTRGGMGGGRGGGGGGGGGMANRGGRGGSMGNNNRGMGMNRNRGGNMYGNGRGGGGGGLSNSPMRGHGSRDRGSFGNYNNRRGGGGSFNAPHHMGSTGGSSGGSFRGHSRPGGGSSSYTNHSRGGRMADGHQNRSANGPVTNNMGSAGGKKDENRRTLTDFKLVGLEIQNLDWRWGAVPSHTYTSELLAVKIEPELIVTHEQSKPHIADEHEKVKVEEVDMDLIVTTTEGNQQTETSISDISTVADTSALTSSSGVISNVNSSTNSNTASRLRIYFHTPHSLDDTHMIPATSTSDTRKNKRKKGEDDDGDGDDDRNERRVPPPPNPSSMVSHNTEERQSLAPSVDIEGTSRDSIAPSVAETNSEGDWLMAAIAGGEDDADEDAEGDIDPDIDVDADADADVDLDADAEGEEYDQTQEATQVVEEDVFLQNHAGKLYRMFQSTLDYVDGKYERVIRSLSPYDVHRTDSRFPDERVDIDEHMSDSELVITLEDHESSHENEDGSTKDLVITKSADVPVSTEPIVNGIVKNETSESRNGDVAHESNSTAVIVSTDSFSSSHELSTILERENLTTSMQAGENSSPSTVPLSSTPTVLDLNGESNVDNSQLSGSILNNGESGTVANEAPNGASIENKNNSEQGHEQDHLPEPPASPLSVVATLPSNSSTTSLTAPVDVFTSSKTVTLSAGGRVPSANRLSISYAAGTRRLVIDADIVETLKVFRSAGRIEVAMTVERITDGFKGILIEALDEDTKAYAPLKDLSEASESDLSLPPFWCFVLPTKTTLIVYLDTERPLSEPKWVKTGDVQDWLKSMFGRMFWVTGDAVGWEKKIEVVDPDPAPTISNILDGWSSNSPVGSQTERQRFLKTHMTESDNVLEILLRLVRGERATPFSQGSSTISSQSISGPLLSALNLSSPHASQQTHVSLAVLAFVRLATEFAVKAVGQEKGKARVDERVGEIIKCLPSHLLYKSLDGMFKEWRVEKKGGR